MTNLFLAVCPRLLNEWAVSVILYLFLLLMKKNTANTANKSIIKMQLVSVHKVQAVTTKKNRLSIKLVCVRKSGK